MPQAPIYTDPLDEVLPRMRCTTKMKAAIVAATEKHDISMADVIRACIANSFGLHIESSEFTNRMFKKAVKTGERR